MTAGAHDAPVTKEASSIIDEPRRPTLQDPFGNGDNIIDRIITQDQEHRVSYLRDTHRLVICAMLSQHVVQFRNQIQSHTNQLRNVLVDPERLTLEREHLQENENLLDSQNNQLLQLKLVQDSEVKSLTRQFDEASKP